MISFAWPWLALCLFLPFIVWYVLPAQKERNSAYLKVPSLQRFNQLKSKGVSAQRFRPAHYVAALIWLLLVLATMRPQWLGEPVNLPVSGRDLMLGIDISGSMAEEDFQYQGRLVSRLVVVKELGRQFIDRRTGDRIGLILFGEQAYVQTPLTYDRKTVQHFLSEAVVGLAGKATAIGDAIGLSLKRLRKRPEESRVLILLTDGANTAGNVEPHDAAEQAKKLGIKIYTIGVGSDGSDRRSVFGFPFGSQGSDLDEKSLTAIAEATGGRYFRAKNTQEMEEIYHIIDSLEPTEDDGEQLRPLYELFIWPLGFALIILMSGVFLLTRKES